MGKQSGWREAMTNIDTNLLKQIIADQKEEHAIPDDYLSRTQEAKLDQLTTLKEIVVLTGVRRCGKSVLLHRARQKADEADFYFNFEDERLATFTASDFQILHQVFIELFGEQKNFYFDEIQNIPGWEMFVRRLYNAGNKIFITGSNANLFSEELGTRLTGRYVSIRVYPLSFQEYAQNKHPDFIDKKIFSTTQTGKIKHLFNHYCIYGGIPEYVKHQQIDYLHSLYESILYRDIIARYKISNDIAIRKLVFFLASNNAKEMSYNSLRKLLGVSSATTISDYCGYLEASYLCFFVNRYSDSAKSQLQSPKKTYFIDPAIVAMLGFRFSEDKGRLLENLVFLELKRKNLEIYYHREEKECDFIVREGNKTLYAIQVCQTLSSLDTKERELAGLLEALTRFSLQEGYILTEHEEAVEIIKKDDLEYKIMIIPIWKWLLNLGYRS